MNLFFKTSYKYLSNHHDVEDVVLQTFNNVFRSLASFESQGTGSLVKWILKIAINQAIKAINKKQPIDFIENDAEFEKIQYNEDTEAMEGVSFERIWEVVNAMPSGYKTVFVMHISDGFTLSEIAQILNISINTSKSQMLKAKRYLINVLKNDTSWKII